MRLNGDKHLPLRKGEIQRGSNVLLKTILFSLLLLNSLNSFADSIIIDGFTRNYIIHLPPGYSNAAKYSLVIAIHGGGGTAEGMDKLTHFNDVADKFKFIVVYPDAVDKNWNDGRPDIPVDKLYDDVKFISRMIDTLASLYNIDTAKIFATGISNGGIMSFRLACELPDKITAIAPVACSMPLNPTYTCTPNRSVPVFVIFGDKDPLVPFEGGEIGLWGIIKRGKVRSVRESVTFWTEHNQVMRSRHIDAINNKFDGTEVQKEIYDEGESSEVQYWLVIGGGHTWPGGQQYLPKSIIGRTSKEFDASEEIWKFFAGKSRN